jgi:hypothetical protein
MPRAGSNDRNLLRAGSGLARDLLILLLLLLPVGAGLPAIF